ncbi:hypothetical protein FRB99_007130 [Tulasnella sp. 403]|nr:hypothetical protein FRB99_007130 [Tulasnella sp. 403]
MTMDDNTSAMLGGPGWGAAESSWGAAAPSWGGPESPKRTIVPPKPSHAPPSYAAPSHASPSYASPSYAAPSSSVSPSSTRAPSVSSAPVTSKPVTVVPDLPKPIPKPIPSTPTPVASTPATNGPVNHDANSSELALLGGTVKQTIPHELQTAPLITRDAYVLPGSGLSSSIRQYGILGSIRSIHSNYGVEYHRDPRLYLNTNVLRELGENFSFPVFKQRVRGMTRNWNRQQKAGFDQRLQLLESFLQPTRQSEPRFRQGVVTIVDLTDPFIDYTCACSLFEIVTRVFVKTDVGTGKLLVVDEAHKYLKQDRGSQVLTDSLISLVRQQRHLGMRLIISTQEPTVIPESLLSLCSITIMHRFSASAWFTHLSKHVASKFDDQAFEHVVKLGVGEAMVLAPSGLGVFDVDGAPTIAPLGQRYILMMTRQRVTADGGASVLTV